jgi:hypothetical protein
MKLAITKKNINVKRSKDDWTDGLVTLISRVNMLFYYILKNEKKNINYLTML